MAAEFNIEGRWPELFEALNVDQRRAVVNAMASNWHEGWVPDREDVENLTSYVSGAIDEIEYDRRADQLAESRRGATPVN